LWGVASYRDGTPSGVGKEGLNAMEKLNDRNRGRAGFSATTEERAGESF